MRKDGFIVALSHPNIPSILRAVANTVFFCQVLASTVAMIINSGILVVVSGLFGVALAPYAAFQQQKITQTIAMKETNEFFQKQLDILHASNGRLSEQVGDMTQSVDR